MTAAGKPRKPRTKRPRASADNERDEILLAALPHVAFDGFSDKVLRQSAGETGVSRDALARLFPDGPVSLVEAFSDWADSRMAHELANTKLAGLKIREKISTAVTMRIGVLGPHKEAARRAAAFLTLPPHAATGVKLLYRTVDAIWRGIGDTSTDFNFYSKRAILAGVYSATLMRWFSDASADGEVTKEFLDRRIEDVMRFERFKAQVRERASSLPTLSDLLNPGSPERSRAKDA